MMPETKPKRTKINKKLKMIGWSGPHSSGHRLGRQMRERRGIEAFLWESAAAVIFSLIFFYKRLFFSSGRRDPWECLPLVLARRRSRGGELALLLPWASPEHTVTILWAKHQRVTLLGPGQPERHEPNIWQQISVSAARIAKVTKGRFVPNCYSLRSKYVANSMYWTSQNDL